MSITERTPFTITDAEQVTGRVRPRLDALERTAQAARRALEHVPTELGAAIEAVSQFMAGQAAVYARPLAAREARLVENKLTEVDAAAADARDCLAEVGPQLAAMRNAMARRSATLFVTDDRPDALEDTAIRAGLALDRLRTLAAQVEVWRPGAHEACARLAQATVIALRRDRVAGVARGLQVLRERAAALRTPPPDDVEATAVLARLEARLGRALPVPRLEWLESALDPLAPPTLVEPE